MPSKKRPTIFHSSLQWSSNPSQIGTLTRKSNLLGNRNFLMLLPVNWLQPLSSSRHKTVSSPRASWRPMGLHPTKPFLSIQLSTRSKHPINTTLLRRLKLKTQKMRKTFLEEQILLRIVLTPESLPKAFANTPSFNCLGKVSSELSISPCTSTVI